MTVTHPLAIAWLERVERLANDLPPGERTELLADLREHLEVALTDDPDGAQVGAVLDRLGDPVDVVAAARSDASEASGAARRPTTDTEVEAPEGLTTPEIIALMALVLAGLVGIFVFPVTILLWAVGIAIVATSGRWRGGEVLGMILLPVAWALPVLSMILPVGSSEGTCEVHTTGTEICSVEQTGLGGPWVFVAVLVGLVLIILGTRWLARAPRGRPRRS